MSLSLFFNILSIVLFALAACFLWFVPEIEVRTCWAVVSLGLASFAAGHLPV